jgi:hypothetical protein
MPMNDKLPTHLRGVRRDLDLPEQNDEVEIGSEGDRKLSWAWVSGKPVFGVSFEWPDGLRRSFRYMQLESDMTLRNGEIVMRFSGSKSFKVTVKGLRLESLFYLLQEDKVRAVRQAVRGFDDGGTLVEKIEIEEEKGDED